MVKYYYYFHDDNKLVPREESKDKKGDLIIIGENQKENDALVKESDGDDYWFHVADHPSGHGVYTGDKLTKEVIIEVALLVKEQSKLKSLNTVKVNYTQIKNLLPTKTKGQVILKKTPETVKV